MLRAVSAEMVFYRKLFVCPMCFGQGAFAQSARHFKLCLFVVGELTPNQGAHILLNHNTSPQQSCEVAAKYGISSFADLFSCATEIIFVTRIVAAF